MGKIKEYFENSDEYLLKVEIASPDENNEAIRIRTNLNLCKSKKVKETRYKLNLFVLHTIKII